MAPTAPTDPRSADVSGAGAPDSSTADSALPGSPTGSLDGSGAPFGIGSCGEPAHLEAKLAEAHAQIADLEGRLKEERAAAPVGRSAEVALAEMEAMEWRERLGALNTKLSARTRCAFAP